jgi:hypothetical protein
MTSANVPSKNIIISGEVRAISFYCQLKSQTEALLFKFVAKNLSQYLNRSFIYTIRTAKEKQWTHSIISIPSSPFSTFRRFFVSILFLARNYFAFNIFSLRTRRFAHFRSIGRFERWRAENLRILKRHGPSASFSQSASVTALHCNTRHCPPLPTLVPTHSTLHPSMAAALSCIKTSTLIARSEQT